MKQRIIWVFLLSLALASASAAQTKTSGTISCTKPDPAYSIDAGDRAGHALGLMKSACTWTNPMQIEDVATKVDAAASCPAAPRDDRS